MKQKSSEPYAPLLSTKPLPNYQTSNAKPLSDKMWRDFVQLAFAAPTSTQYVNWRQLFLRLDLEQQGFVTVPQVLRHLQTLGYKMQEYSAMDVIYLYRKFASIHPSQQLNQEQFFSLLLQ